MSLEIFKKRKKTFIGYITAGDGGIDYSVDCALALADGGVDILELGVPFSDPIGDGPVIQEGMKRALSYKIRPFDVLTIVERIRRHSNIPIVLMTYANPLLSQPEDFFSRALSLSIEALLVVDLPFEEKIEKFSTLKQAFLICPSTSKQRVKMMDSASSAFLYYVIQKGTTGERKNTPQDYKEAILDFKSFCKSPIVAGFGISTREMAKDVLCYADGFVVGSYFVKAMQNKTSTEKIRELAKQIDPR